MEPLAVSFLLRSAYDLLPNVTNLKLWGYTDSNLCSSCKSNRDTLRHVLSACPQSLQMYTWRHNKVLEVVIELLRAQCETANQQPVTAKEHIIQFLREGECPVRIQKIPIWSYWRELVTRNFLRISSISAISSSYYSNRKAGRHCRLVRLKEECPLHRIDCPLGRKPGGGTQNKRKISIRHTACRLRGKGVGYAMWFLLRLVVGVY